MSVWGAFFLVALLWALGFSCKSLLYFCDVVVQSEASPHFAPPIPRRPTSPLPNPFAQDAAKTPQNSRTEERSKSQRGDLAKARARTVSLCHYLCVSVFACARIFRDSGHVCLQFSLDRYFGIREFCCRDWYSV